MVDVPDAEFDPAHHPAQENSEEIRHWGVGRLCRMCWMCRMRDPLPLERGI